MSEQPVLIACDMSGTTHTVLQAGLELARILGASPQLLHVDGNLDVVREGLGIVDEAEISRMAVDYHGEIRRAMGRLVEEAGPDPDTTSILIRVGRPYAEVLAQAEESGAGAIVVGARAHSRLERLLVGRTAARVVRRARCPVLVVNVARPWTPIERILYPTDLHDDAARVEEVAGRLAGSLGAVLRVLHVAEVGDHLGMPYVLPTQALREIAERQGARMEAVRARLVALGERHVPGPAKVRVHLVADPDPTAAIVLEAEETGSDLIVMGTHGRRGLARVLLGSVTDGVLRHARTSVLCVRLGREPAAAPIAARLPAGGDES